MRVGVGRNVIACFIVPPKRVGRQPSYGQPVDLTRYEGESLSGIVSRRTPEGSRRRKPAVRAMRSTGASQFGQRKTVPIPFPYSSNAPTGPVGHPNECAGRSNAPRELCLCGWPAALLPVRRNLSRTSMPPYQTMVSITLGIGRCKEHAVSVVTWRQGHATSGLSAAEWLS
jgi:hypothetical protein